VKTKVATGKKRVNEGNDRKREKRRDSSGVQNKTKTKKLGANHNKSFLPKEKNKGQPPEGRSPGIRKITS